MNEITDNVLNHSASPTGGVVGMTRFTARHEVVFCVADSGLGIRETLREGHANIQDDQEALEEAVKAGVTRNPLLGQGNGLAGTRTITSNSGGEMTLVSGHARLNVSSAGSTVVDFSSTRQFPGTFVVARIRTDSRVPLDELLSLPSRTGTAQDIIDMRYEDPHQDAFVIRLLDEPDGFGSRSAGRALRVKCNNLLDANPRYPVHLDWSGVTMVSSSFADECLGKLFVEMGATAYSARIRHRAMAGLVQALVDKAIMQRIAQVMALVGSKRGSSVSGDNLE
ncbi:MAG: DUF4325 domain-containing protein [Myxococcales bacterium]|nr:DUF4325 domain-containing protein [Myxococcales bacterium]